jgi:hypothetical protein
VPRHTIDIENVPLYDIDQGAGRQSIDMAEPGNVVSR